MRRLWLWGGALALVLLAGLYLVPVLEDRALEALYESVTLPIILGSGLLALWRARIAPTNVQRVAWSLVGTAGLVWALGEASWTYAAVVQGREVPTPSWIDIPYLLNIPLMAAGVLAFAWRRDAARLGAVRLLDAVVVTGSIFLVVWVGVLRGLVADAGLATASAVVTLLYPMGDLLVLVGLALAFMRLDRAGLVALWPLLVGLLVVAVGDLGYSFVVLQTGGYGATGFDLAWTAGAWLIGVAALRPAPVATAHRRPASRAEQWLPTLALAVVLPLVVADVLPGRRVDLVTLLTCVLLGLLVLARQALLLDVHLRLSRALTETQNAVGLGAWSWDGVRRRVVLSDTAANLVGAPDTTTLAFGDLLLQLHPEDRAGLETDWGALLDGGQPFERVVRTPAAPTPRHLKVTGQAAPTPHGILLDVTRDVQLREQAAHAQALEEEAGRLTELNRLKTQFINMAAHELNTPLTPITISLATLKRGDAARKPQAETLAILERNVDRLVRLLRDVLDSARLQSDRIKFNLRTVDLASLAGDALEEHRLVAEERNLRLTFQAEPTPVQADAARLGEVLANLLSNSVKFTPSGGEVIVAVGRRDGAAFLEVRDTGRGLDAGELHLLFQPFSQVGAQDAATPTGTGLGLYIARGIVERLGGRLWAESPGLGKGATFRMELPLASGMPAPDGVAAP